MVLDFFRDLQSNCIISIEDKAFPEKMYLATLNLENNKFRFLHQYPFANLSALAILLLQNNMITIIPDGTFHGTQLLDNLYVFKSVTLISFYMNIELYFVWCALASALAEIKL